MGVSDQSYKKRRHNKLGLLYYHGVYKNDNESESDKVTAIIEPDAHKAADYFRMVIDKKLLGI